jgi:chromate transporter
MGFPRVKCGVNPSIPAVILTLGAVIAVFRFQIGMITVLAACSGLGIVYYLITGQAG